MAAPVLSVAPPPEAWEHASVQPMTVEEFLAWEHTGFAEWIDGKAYQYMAATLNHQDLVLFLSMLLKAFVDISGLGRVITAPYAMRGLPGGPAREPDIMFVATENFGRMRRVHIEGPADLVIEVVSDDSPRRDRSDKLDEYAAAGVCEYWIIDSRDRRPSATFLVLDGDTFRAAPLDSEGIYHSTVLPGFWLNTAWLWTEPRDSLGPLLQIVGPEALTAKRPTP